MYISSRTAQVFVPLSFIALFVIAIVIACMIEYRINQKHEQREQMIAKRDAVFFRCNGYAQQLGNKK
jgi:heme/copper-type cytochrome/quinol oxidase subunit 2